jgi:hypothetical protein
MERQRRRESSYYEQPKMIKVQEFMKARKRETEMFVNELKNRLSDRYGSRAVDTKKRRRANAPRNFKSWFRESRKRKRKTTKGDFLEDDDADSVEWMSRKKKRKEKKKEKWDKSISRLPTHEWLAKRYVLFDVVFSTFRARFFLCTYVLCR